LGKALVITEKPSVANDIAAALGGFEDHDGYFERDDYVVTFAVGHLFELLQPEEIDPKYKAWTLEVLPILPAGDFQIKPKSGQSERIRTIKKLIQRDDVDSLINACDAGREGELIFREIVKFFKSEKPIRRLWLQSMTTNAIVKGFESLQPGENFAGLAAAAECRAYSDWLIGMNATRALTKRLASRKEKTAWSAGRVQTPTLALLVDRELEVLAHVPRGYWRIVATFAHDGNSYEGVWIDRSFKAGEDGDAREDRIFDAEKAAAIVAAAQGQPAAAGESRKPSKESAPPLFDLTSLQREGNRRYSWSARRTLSAAQRCYERHKLLTYPRTDSRCLPEDYRDTIGEVLKSFSSDAALQNDAASEAAPHYARSARELLDDGLENDEKIFDNDGVSDHFAIVPTGTLPETPLTGDDARLYDLVVRRFLGAFKPPAVWERVERITEVGEHAFQSKARTLREPGWRSVLADTTGDEEAIALPPLSPTENEISGVAVEVSVVAQVEEKTKPPPRISEARLLSLMENAGKQVDDEDIAAVLHEKGIGTPATRAEIFENLIRKGYVLRQGKGLRPTVKGIRLIDSLRRINIDRLASPALTGELEQHLIDVEHGKRDARGFMAEVTQYAESVVERAKTFGYEELYADAEELGPCPSCGRPVVEMAWFYRCKQDDPDIPREEDCPMRFWKDTSGRYLDPGSVRAIIQDGRTAELDGFTARSGRTYRGHIELEREEWKLKVRSAGWNEETASDIPEYEINTEPLGPCPLSCGELVIETSTEYVCAGRKAIEAKIEGEPANETPEERKERRKRNKERENEKCGFVFPRTVCKREITRDEAERYRSETRTELLQDFTSRFGRPFAATLVLQDTGRHGFEFQPRQAKAKKSADGDGGAEPAKGSRKKAAGRKKAAKKKKKAPRKKASRKKAAARKASPAPTSSTGEPAES
jgi:DNA topoisomerase-3